TSVTEDTLVWMNASPFKRIIVHKNAVPHHFPIAHTDVIEHVIDYQMPSGQLVNKVWDFDGSVVLKRTEGEMSAKCMNETSNILALNLTHEILNGKMNVERARIEFGNQIA